MHFNLPRLALHSAVAATEYIGTHPLNYPLDTTPENVPNILLSELCTATAMPTAADITYTIRLKGESIQHAWRRFRDYHISSWPHCPSSVTTSPGSPVCIMCVPYGIATFTNFSHFFLVFHSGAGLYLPTFSIGHNTQNWYPPSQMPGSTANGFMFIVESLRAVNDSFETHFSIFKLSRNTIWNCVSTLQPHDRNCLGGSTVIYNPKHRISIYAHLPNRKPKLRNLPSIHGPAPQWAFVQSQKYKARNQTT